MDVRKGRKATEVRPVRMIRGYTKQAPGSVLIQLGETWVLCTVSIQEGVPKWREESGLGWLTAEYDMLPGSTGSRRPRNREGVDGRSQEIQRLIGRSLRAVVDFTVLGSRTLVVDCDVLQADGGTRSAAITGGYVALCDAVDEGVKRGLFDRSCVTDSVAAVSVGVVKDKILVDLNYKEDVSADVDLNLVMTGSGRIVEVQATGEHSTFASRDLDQMVQRGSRAIRQLIREQQKILRGKKRTGT